ncbi:hypothetical protein [Streptomyces lonegramiae]|uniref:Uncharacterized protein n=1 Tax=Streptomyces lonegramiae TaxID=3075524 RepID=A0ABU2XFT9_9ACTN|nr:hypothetical protein [Streptomyces sp. DSM 41529]MDT0544804.1 hypothetical protein [Streptomyces sp. DSM 41529]
MSQSEYVDLPSAQICARELDEGRYHCFGRTTYRSVEQQHLERKLHPAGPQLRLAGA